MDHYYLVPTSILKTLSTLEVQREPSSSHKNKMPQRKFKISGICIALASEATDSRQPCFAPVPLLRHPWFHIRKETLGMAQIVCLSKKDAQKNSFQPTECIGQENCWWQPQNRGTSHQRQTLLSTRNMRPDFMENKYKYLNGFIASKKSLMRMDVITN